MMPNSKTKYFLLIVLLLVATSVFAQSAEYTPLEKIDELINDNNKVTIASFLPGIVRLIIMVAGGLAVIRIIIGGIQYMSTDAWGGKKEAKSTITNAILGLLLAIAAYTILNTVNPALVNFNLQIEGLATGEGLDFADATQKTADQLGCEDCVHIDTGEFAVSPSACSNDPCYAKEAVISILGTLKNALAAKGDVGDPDFIRSIAWQVTRAFPPRNLVAADPDCFKLGTNESGECIGLSLPNNDISNVKRLLDAVMPMTGWVREYRVTSPARQNFLKSGIRAVVGEPNTLQYEQKIVCRQPITNTSCGDTVEYLYLDILR